MHLQHLSALYLRLLVEGDYRQRTTWKIAFDELVKFSTNVRITNLGGCLNQLRAADNIWSFNFQL